MKGKMGHCDEERENVPSEEIISAVGEQESFHTKKPSLGKEGGGLLVVDDSIHRHVDRRVVNPYTDHMV